MKLYANSKPFSQVINPFQFDQVFSIHADNWNFRCVWSHGKSGFEFKVRDFRFGNRTRNAQLTSPSPPPPPPPPRSPEKSFPKSWPYGFPLYRSSRTSEKKTVKLFSWTVSFFCLLCMRVRDNCSVKNSSKSSLVSPHPPPPPAPCLKKEKERKTKDSLICVEIRFQISRRSIRISKIQVRISQSNTPALICLRS